MTLSIQVYSAPGGRLLADLTDRADSLEFATNKHGCAWARAKTDLILSEAFRLRNGIPHVVISDSAGTVWEGRLEDPRIASGFQLAALGYWRALSDPLYSALWSASGTRNWRNITAQDLAGRKPELYYTDTNNRLEVALTKNTVYANNTDIGGMVYDIPHLSVRDVNYVTVAYAYDLPVNWVARLVARDNAWGSAVVNNITVVGGVGAGTLNWDLSATPRAKITMEVFNATGAAYGPVALETGAYYLRLTSARLLSTGSSCTADEIATALVTATNTLNSTQLASGTNLIEAPGLDLLNEIYEDKRPADILDYLVSLGDNQTPPRVWECGVWGGQQLHFRPRGSVARTWYIDATEEQIEWTMNALYNSVYATYTLEDGRVQRTTTSTDTDSISAAGLTRQAFVSANTTSATQAQAQRGMYLQDRKDPIPRVWFDFEAIYDAAGARYPLWLARSGDTLIARNLPPSLSTAIDKIRVGRIDETVYSARRGQRDNLRVTFESPLPSLDTQLAQLAAGVRRL